MFNKKPVVLVLNSAHNKYPIGSDTWIQGTIKAVNSLSGQPVKMLCSTEPVMWDFVTYLAGKNSMEIILIVMACDDNPGRDEFSRLVEEYALDINSTTPLFLGEQPGNQPKKIWRLRDRLAFETADTVYPVSIKPGGKLDKLISEAGYSEKVGNEFRIPRTHENLWHCVTSYDFSGYSVNPFPDGKWIVHWTRSSHGQWPAEKAWEFYRDLVNHPESYVRSARETLRRILTEQLIRGSSWKLPGGQKAVALTSLPPEESVSLMRWRKRFVRFSFEPYGVAIGQDVLVRMGAREIRYEKKDSASSQDSLFVQSPGEKADWTKEKEWRIRGDIELDRIDEGDYFAIVPFEEDVEYVKERIGKKKMRFHVLLR